MGLMLMSMKTFTKESMAINAFNSERVRGYPL